MVQKGSEGYKKGYGNIEGTKGYRRVQTGSEEYRTVQKGTESFRNVETVEGITYFCHVSYSVGIVH